MHDVIGYVLGVDTQVILVSQRQQCGLVGGAQPEVHCGAVLNEARNQPPDVIGRIQLRCFSDGQQGFVIFHKNIDVIDMNKTVPQHPGHAGIDLGNDQVCRQCCGQGDVHRYTQTHPAEIIRRRYLNQGDMDRQQPALKQTRDG